MEAMRQKHGAGLGLFQFPDLVTVVNIYHLVVVFTRGGGGTSTPVCPDVCVEK